MTAKVNATLPRVLSVLEQDVFQALQTLPDGFVIRAGAEPIKFESDGLSYRYEPDFIIDTPSGHHLIVEVKSHHSLSLSNMAKFNAISQHAKNQGAEFLVLIPDADSPSSSNRLMQQFDNVNVAFTSGPSNVVATILDTVNSSNS